MTALATPPQLMPSISASPSPDDQLAMEDEGLYELVNGCLLEKHLGSDSNWTAGQIATRVNVYMWQTKAGYVLPEQTFQCFPGDPDGFRRPDVAYIAAGRYPRPWPRGHVRVRPDLAVEVVSPTDKADDVERKVADYRSAGIPLVWFVFPAVRVVRVFLLGGPITDLRPGETLVGEPVLPGFAVAVADLFPPA